jgi:hypothetical protein
LKASYFKIFSVGQGLSNLVCESGVVIETTIMTTMTTNDQLELGFNATQSRIYGRRRETRVARAQWWFAKMRETVANAVDWRTPDPRSEQILFPGANREVQI